MDKERKLLEEKRRSEFNLLNEAEKIEKIRSNGLSIKYFNNPNEITQMIAVKSNPYAIQFIENPTINVQLEATKDLGGLIAYIKNPYEEVQLKVIEDNGIDYINCIKKPTPKVLELVERKSLIRINLESDQFVWDYKVKKNILIQGDNGSGKTVALECIEKDIRKQGFNTVYVMENDVDIDFIKDILYKGDNDLFIFIDEINILEKEEILHLLTLSKKLNLHMIVTSSVFLPIEIQSNFSVRFEADKNLPHIFSTFGNNRIKFSK